ncbi:MAG TPA: M28 family peptidase [Gemmatimonadales bacterium]|nr:M28 family peptidase [Gemmatimonadales bacterium]
MSGAAALVALLPLFLPSAAVAQTIGPLKHTPERTGPEITAADLMTRLYIFADDSMQGREAGTIGNVKGTDYIAGEIKRMGLIPGGDSGTYFQTVPLKTRSFDTTSTLTVAGAPLTAVTDYLPVARHSIDAVAVPIVFGGELSDSLHRIAEAEAAGKLVVLKVTAGITRVRAPPAVGGAVAIALIGLENLAPQVVAFFSRPQNFLDDPAVAPPETMPVLLISSAAAAKMFTAPLDQLTPGATGGTAGLHIHYRVEPIPFPARNVIGIIPGRDPALRGEYVAIGAHNDHLGRSRVALDHDSVRIWNHVVRPEGADDGDRRATPAQQATVDSLLAAFRASHPGTKRADSTYNGADDDGSGSVAALEVAEKIASLAAKPKRSILFVWHTGEEKGLLGSRYFTDHPTLARDSIVAQLNMDMVGRGDADDEVGRTKDGIPIHGSPGYLQLVGSRRLSTELGDLIERVNREGRHELTLDYSIDANGHPSNIYCRSDHYEYARYGIPITFFTTGLHSDYHQLSDEPEYIDYGHMARVVRFVEDVAVHVADLDHRVVVDHPKPDPRGPCRQ